MRVCYLIEAHLSLPEIISFSLSRSMPEYMDACQVWISTICQKIMRDWYLFDAHLSLIELQHQNFGLFFWSENFLNVDHFSLWPFTDHCQTFFPLWLESFFDSWGTAKIESKGFLQIMEVENWFFLPGFQNSDWFFFRAFSDARARLRTLPDSSQPIIELIESLLSS